MLFMVFAAGGVVLGLWDNITANFQTNIGLNGLIFIVIFVGCIKIFFQNYCLWGVARYLQKVEDLENDDEADETAAELLSKELKNKEYFLDRQKMQRALEGLQTYGHMQLSAHDAAVIRAKLDRHIKADKSVATYLAGILVMLGLIGTFWGLLITISSVGAAMGDVSKSMAVAGSDESMAAMSHFIDGISKPLQGMGIAFSSSLFGLTGSLFVGMLNFFAGLAQFRFLESVNRWIDAHVPEIGSDIAEPQEMAENAQDHDLKAWLGAFIQLSAKANKRMTMNFAALSQLTEAINRQFLGHSEFMQVQKDIQTSLQSIGKALQDLKSLTNSKQDEAIFSSKLLGVMEANGEKLNNLCEAIQKQAGDQEKTQSELQMKSNELSQISVQISSILQEIDQNSQFVQNRLSKKDT